MVHFLAGAGVWTSRDSKFAREEKAMEANKRMMQLFRGSVKGLVDQMRIKTGLDLLQPRPRHKGGSWLVQKKKISQ